MVPKNTIRAAEPNLNDDDIEAVVMTLQDSQISSRAPIVKEFEEAFAKYCYTKHAISVNSGSSALFLALEAFHFEPHHEVIIPAMAYIAIPNAVNQAGLQPILVDVGADGNIDPEKVEEAITPNTRAIIAVHTYGNQCDMVALNRLAYKYNLVLIEDAAESIGTQITGHVGVVSFFANKTMTTGEGGMVMTSLSHVAEEVRKLRDQYPVEILGQRYWHPRMGYSLCMSGIQAALGLSQLSRMPEFLKKKKEIADYYTKGLETIKLVWLSTRPRPFATTPHPWMYPVLVNSEDERNRLLAHLAKNGIEGRNFFPCINWQGHYKTPGEYPVAESISVTGLYLPSGTTITEAEQEKVVQTIKSFYENKERSDPAIA
jgi:perosamine synthetase